MARPHSINDSTFYKATGGRTTNEAFDDAGIRPLQRRDGQYCTVAIYPGHPDPLREERLSGATLWWTDWVANDWAEWYPDEATAYLRFAALVACGAFDDVVDSVPGFFRQDPEAFAEEAERFFAATVDRDTGDDAGVPSQP